MGTILTTLERLLDRQGRRRPEPTSAKTPPYPDASKAVEHFQLKLAERVQASRNHSPGWKESTTH